MNPTQSVDPALQTSKRMRTSRPAFSPTSSMQTRSATLPSMGTSLPAATPRKLSGLLKSDTCATSISEFNTVFSSSVNDFEDKLLGNRINAIASIQHHWIPTLGLTFGAYGDLRAKLHTFPVVRNTPPPGGVLVF
jgi:hypothetical protein